MIIKNLLKKLTPLITTTIALLLIANTTKASETQKSLHSSYRSILIFLDDSEEKIGAITGDILQALSLKAGPIIASSSLLANFFSQFDCNNQTMYAEQKSNNFNLATLMALDNNHYTENHREALENILGQSMVDTQDNIQKCILAKVLNFKNEDWIIKKISNELYLLIPKDYCKKLSINFTEFLQNKGASPLTETEKFLGLKVNHMETIDNIYSIAPINEKPDFCDYFYTSLNNIFCTNKELNNTNIPSWTIYMAGHGSTYKRIVGMSLEQFKKTLDFYEKKIKTQLLIYESCYAAGTNNQIIFASEKETRDRQKTYSFPIVTHALVDATTTERTAWIEENLPLRIRLNTNYKEFIEETSKEIIDYAFATQKLFPLTPISENLNWANTPQIKFPGLDWFSVMETGKEVVAIGSILSKTRTKPLNIVTFFQKKSPSTHNGPRALLLYGSTIPFEIIINNCPAIDAIISMIPGNATHNLEKISSDKKATEIINLFMKIDKLDAEKFFFIKNINNNIFNVIIHNRKTEGNLLSNTSDKFICDATYTQNDTVYKIAKRGSKPEEITNDFQKAVYQKNVNKFLGKITLIETITLQEQGKNTYMYDAFNNKLSKFASPYIIQKIISKDSNKPISLITIILALQKNCENPDVLLHIKNITGTYSKTWSMMKGLPIEDKALIKIKNVIIHKNFFWFTHKKKFYKSTQAGATLLDKDYLPEFVQIMSGKSENDTSPITQDYIHQLESALQKKIPTKEKTTKEGLVSTTSETSISFDELKKYWEQNPKRVFETADLKTIQKFIDEKVPYSRGIFNTTLIEHAVDSNRVEVVELLLDNGHDVNTKTYFNTSLIEHATNNGTKPKMILMLAQRGAKIPANTDAMLYQAITKKMPEVASLLIKNGADVNALYNFEPMIINAVNHESTQIVELLINNGAKIDNIINVLLERAIYHCPDVVEFLIKKGADVNYQYQYTKPIKMALQALSECEQQLKHRHERKETIRPWHSKYRDKYLNVVKTLIKHGAQIEQKDIDQAPEIIADFLQETFKNQKKQLPPKTYK